MDAVREVEDVVATERDPAVGAIVSTLNATAPPLAWANEDEKPELLVVLTCQ